MDLIDKMALTGIKGIAGVAGSTMTYFVASLNGATEWLQFAAVGAGLCVALLSGISIGLDIKRKLRELRK